ncbi:MAG: hypothetical protein HDS01_06125 [Bacteroides sp.]|nr:hypothetical protein [Bacteroides sp.]
MNTSRFRNIFTNSVRTTLTVILFIVNILVAVATIVAAYGGYADPSRHLMCALISMMLPGILIAGLLTAIIDLIFRWRFALIQCVAWLISLPSLLVYSPMHIGTEKLTPEEESRSFTLLTYNVLQFWDFRGNVPGLERNATIDYILDTDADIVNLQEVEFIKSWPLWQITDGQIRELTERYPYRVVNVSKDLTVLSKYPFEFLSIPMPGNSSEKMALFRLNVMGETIHLFNVHLESIGLSMADKQLYTDLFKKAPASELALKREMRDVKHQLIDKLSAAFKKRVNQARFIRETIDSIGGNFIVAGDFNDIQGCYAIRTILGDDMHDAYADNAFGPTITYHGNRFYFRIDHVLYGGDLRAVDIERGNQPSSDHYPLLTTFVLGSSDRDKPQP